MKRYVVGFVITTDSNCVLLVEKKRPEWQSGRLNGVGGKIEQGESPQSCMFRECFEETNVAVKPTDWRRFCIVRGGDVDPWEVHFLARLKPTKR